MRDEHVDRFTSKMYARLNAKRNPFGSKKEWDSLSIEQKRQKLERYVNDELQQIGVPPIKITLMNSPNSFGGFVPSKWEIQLHQTYLKIPLNHEGAKRMSDTLFHEARHAEQDFRIARNYAADSSQEEIKELTGLPENICSVAVEIPLKQPEYQDFVGNSAALIEHNEVTDWQSTLYGYKRDDMRQIVNEARNNPSEEAYKRYRELPHEKDAHKLGDKVQNKYDKLVKSKNPKLKNKNKRRM